MEELKYKIALSLIPGIGNVSAKKLVAHCGGAEGIFKEKKRNLLKIDGLGEYAAQKVLSANVMEAAEKEVRFIEDNEIQVDYYLDKNYPRRLLHCDDGPILLYSKGNINWNAERMISIVGTRRATIKGQAICEKLVNELQPYGATIVSGLAYGIDITAHQAALKAALPTIGIMASGIDKVYPAAHRKTAERMQENGGIATDYRHKTIMLPINFAERNRIVAGLSDAVIVIESSAKGGSLITADLANGYNRDVFAVPGRIDDSHSVGCNRLIKSNKAVLIESIQDIEYIMGWQKSKQSKPILQKQLFVELSEEEQQLLAGFGELIQMPLDELSLNSKLPISKTAGILLNLEFKGLIRSLPGKLYQRI